MEGLALGENYGLFLPHAGPSTYRRRSSTPNSHGALNEGAINVDERAEDSGRSSKEIKRLRKLERAQAKAMRAAKDARTALVHENEAGDFDVSATDERDRKPKESVIEKKRRVERRDLENVGAIHGDEMPPRGRKSKSQSGWKKAKRPPQPPVPSSDPEDPFTSSPDKLPPSSLPSSPDNRIDPRLDFPPSSPPLRFPGRSGRIFSAKHPEVNGKDPFAKLLFADEQGTCQPISEGHPAEHKTKNHKSQSSVPHPGEKPPAGAASKKSKKDSRSGKPDRLMDVGTAKVPDDIVSSSKGAATGLPPRKRRKKIGETETYEELRKEFRKPAAMHQWLASKWVNLGELKRLEERGIIQYKKGKFSDAEKAAIREYLTTFKQVNRVDQAELVELIHAKGRFSERKEFPKFWPEVAAVVPGRPVKYVKDHVKRVFDPLARKGPWTPKEDELLTRAQQSHPNQWAKISQIVERPELDCRCRWRDELQHVDTKQEGHWTQDESTRLIEIVMELNTSLGQDPHGSEAPWDLVVEKMNGQRTRTQCRKKWQAELRFTAAQLPKPPARVKRKKRKETASASGVSQAQGADASAREHKVKKHKVMPKVPKSPAQPTKSRIKSRETVDSDLDA
ncbi:hypothetical protein BD324DRAFT_624745 [Kockovaella imperatae]|uniref:Homeodomain-like protein n=1 Tax=Kockovaella imperatae TaxID=4999 RepID=A0A1Y1UG97_9TREE|nr:hypothetical protein BD324DRAFT_624745 [Kockovaella imperatae]ORX37090.1 hypothetical protein BD324DRAFT_624745 [Kockovaella imperatae]